MDNFPNIRMDYFLDEDDETTGKAKKEGFADIVYSCALTLASKENDRKITVESLSRKLSQSGHSLVDIVDGDNFGDNILFDAINTLIMQKKFLIASGHMYDLERFLHGLLTEQQRDNVIITIPVYVFAVNEITVVVETKTEVEL